MHQNSKRTEDTHAEGNEERATHRQAMSEIVEKVHQKVEVSGEGLRIEKLGVRQVGHEPARLGDQTADALDDVALRDRNDGLIGT